MAGARTGLTAMAVLVGAIAGLACDDGTGIEDEVAECLREAGVSGPAVGIRSFAFFPDTIRVAPGSVVTWVNCEDPDVDAHTSTADGGAWDSGLLFPGDTFERTFDAPGTFPYHCVPHPSMRAAVIVEDGT